MEAKRMSMTVQSVAKELLFSGEVAIVTGGARGIGQKTCETFASGGANIAVVDINQEGAKETASDIAQTYGIETLPVECDVSEKESVDEMVERVQDEFGRLDILVNNAAAGIGKPTFLDTEAEEWEKPIGVCYRGTMNCSHAALPYLKPDDGGSIVNLASDSYKGNDPGMSVYGSSKAAIVSFSKTLSKEVGDDGVRVNCVSPGTTRTPATEQAGIMDHEEKILESYALKRLGEPQDIANAIVYLASDAASWVTGQTLSVNGGYLRG
jgi:NAD(P)-dependent dehydrogenase (short-subunit alcohol dehydrogenase family)